MINWLANPARFTRFSSTVLPWCARATFAVLAAGLYLALVSAPPDYQQGESVRIMYIHVPAAWMALSVYLFVAVASAIALVWRHPLAEIAAAAGGGGRGGEMQGLLDPPPRGGGGRDVG
jgi:heme exporter protein C